MNKKFTHFFVSRAFLLATTLLCTVVASGGISATAAQSEDQASQAPVAQSQIDVTFTVIEQDGALPVIGAKVVLIGNNNKAALTDASGMATLKNVPANGQVLVSFVGMTTQTVSINGKNKVQVELTPDAINIQDVVVVGFGSTKKVNLTGAVASVNSKVLEDRPITNLGQGLQGVVPNLNITTGTGMPGQGASYNIRGTTSLNGGGPLILIDGVQMDPNLINPQDVSNVTVLKDAASAAIYGARGAYGVILITTKQGHSDQKPTLSVSANLGFHQPTTLPTPLRSVDYANYVNMVANNSGWGSPFFDKEYMDHIYAYQANPTPENSVFIHSQSGNKNQYDYCGETDWYRDIMNEVALNQQYNIQLNGGTKNTSYFLSMGLVRDKGMLKAYPDKNTRWNTNINVKSQVTKWLEISGRAMYNFSVGDIPNTNFVNWQNGLFLNGLRPLMPIYHPDGHYSGQGIWTHPMAVAEQGGFQTNRRSDLWLTGAIKATPIKGMNIVADYTFNYYNQDVQDKTRQFYEYTAVPGTEQLYPWTKPSYVQNYTNQDTYSAFNAYIDYERQMRRHYLKVMVGYNQENKFNRGYGASRPNMISDDMNFIGLATGDISLVNNISTGWGTQGIVFRVNYNFGEKYLLEINGRYDVSSKFPKDHRGGFFPSASVAWRLSKESFMERASSWLSDFKIRASYGQLGNQSINANFPYFPSMGLNTRYGYILGDGFPVAVSAPGLVSNNFTWETVTQLDLGIDLSFFNGRLNASFDWYNRQTSGMLAPAKPFPAQLGATPPNINAAALSTKGWELSLGWADRTKGGFGYNINFIMSDYVSKITEYDNPTGSLGSYYVGQTLGEKWGYTTEGKFKDQADIDAHASQAQMYGGKWYPGDIKYADLNGDQKINNGNNTLEKHGDLSVIGNDTPRFNFGLTFNADYKGIDLTLFFQGTLKRDYFPGGQQFWGIANEWGTPIGWQMNNYWTPENPNGYLPRQSFNNGNTYTQSGYILNGAYVRLKELTLGYTLPQAITMKGKVQKFRIYFSAQNLFNITSLPSQYDPETLSYTAYPVQRVFSLGVNLTF